MIGRTIAFLLLLTAPFMAGAALADEPIGVFANSNTGCIQFIDPYTQASSSPLLAGELGSSQKGLLDVVITSDGKTAIVSNYGDSEIFFIDISGGFDKRPKLLGSCKIPFYAVDLALTPDGKYVLVTDSDFSSKVAVVRVSTRKLASVKNTGNTNAVSVLVAPDGTVFVADYGGQAIRAYTLSGKGILTLKKTNSTKPYSPSNIIISPDGKALIAVSCSGLLGFYRSGSVLFLEEVIPLSNGPGQSCVFSKDGKKAYYLTSSSAQGTLVHVLNVMDYGSISDSGKDIKLKPKRPASNLFGVDTMALDPSGKYLYVSNPALTGGLTSISVVDLTTNTQVDSIKANGIPVGIAFATIED